MNDNDLTIPAPGFPPGQYLTKGYCRVRPLPSETAPALFVLEAGVGFRAVASVKKGRNVWLSLGEGRWALAQVGNTPLVSPPRTQGAERLP